ncbi:N-formylglutamate amidohydrolase [Methylobacterium brachythecii]|uniref:N-formylglutamate amidohydrolase n=1 Tax=Methylobacterium brachythecii TaxID=1176177 RepID=A0A7W6F9C8_9HYPH|nr:N-formylglutamate amidohydrolase [Methylobacterium brachythecii]MBB3905016.1 putative N-formylglutamate amidohydrolase [Methylobacterium brachythecii]GLS46285.1 N-formylglutamate amidohydrolase [Methylobacterium brachythecii]
MPTSAALRAPFPNAAQTLERPEQPVEVIPGDARRGLLILCDHASNAVPDDLDRLGVAEHEFGRHIAYDIGAAAVTRRLAGLLGVPAVLTMFSRLVIDPNRGRADPTLVMRLSDGAIVPGNARIDADGVAERIRRFYAPYDRAIDSAVGQAQAAGKPPMILTMHSFTRYWRGIERPWQVGILYDRDERLSRPLIEALQADPAGLTVGDNAPYGGGLPGDTVDRHATARKLPNALVEIRQDLLLDEPGIEEWAQRFAGLMRPMLA